MSSRPLLVALALSLNAGAQAEETLKLEIVTAEGHRYQAEQTLGKSFESFDSGAIPGSQPPREYQAIRCNTPWGAMKYHLTLASGPGYQLQAHGERLSLQVVEHSVISEDRTIAAMSVHCIDLEPKQVMKSLFEIELDRGKASTDQLQLENGYLLEYRYTP